jgi:hypothetical protein
MATSFLPRLIHLRLLLPILLLAGAASAQNWAGAEEQLAGKIVSVMGAKVIAVAVSNRSSLSGPVADEIRRGLLTQLAARGVRFVSREQAGAVVQVSLSEDLQNYVWVAEIRQGGNEPSVVMVSMPRVEMQQPEPEGAAMTLRKDFLWFQPERILDLAIIDGNPRRMLVLNATAVGVYRLQDGRWQIEQSLSIPHSRPWPRDLRGRLTLRKDHLFDAYLPGVLCRSTGVAPLAINCYEGDEPWPLGTDLSDLNAFFASSRNYFNGTLSPGVGKQTSAPAFYSAAALPRNGRVLWLLAAVDGQVHLLDGLTDQVVRMPEVGSDVATLRSGCGSGWQVLASGGGEGSGDTVRAFELPDREPLAVSGPLEIKSSVTAMWTESGASGVVAVVLDSETGGYEAFRLSVACNR